MLKKILLILAALFALLVLSALILPFVYREKIVALVKEEINKSVNARVDFGDYDLSLLSTFPQLTLQLGDVRVTGVAPFEGDTLTSMQSIEVAVDLMTVIKGEQIEIKSVRLKNPLVNLIVLKDGTANWDIVKPDTTAAKAVEKPTAFKAALKEFSIENGRIRYEDASLDMRTGMDALGLVADGDFTQDFFVLNTSLTAENTSFWYGGVKYVHHAKVDLKAGLDMDMPAMKFTFRDNELKLNELVLGLNGFVAMPGEDISMDLNLEARQNEFRHFLSMVPGVYREGFSDLKSSGTLALKASVKGVYGEKRMPGFSLNLKIDDGNFKYPSMPAEVRNVGVDLQVNNPDGVPDHTLIDLRRLHAELGGQPFDLRLRVRTPVSDADFDAMARGTVDLGNIRNFIPLEKGTTLNGVFKSDVLLKGRMSAIEQKRYEDLDISGTLSLDRFSYSGAEFRQGVRLEKCSLTFNPRNITLNNLEAYTGHSDFRASGTLDNLPGWFFKKEELAGSLNVNSNRIDLDELNTGDSVSQAPSDTSAMSIVEVPDGISFTVNASIGRLDFNKMLLENIYGKIVLNDEQLDMQQLRMRTLGGDVTMSGRYGTRVRKKADLEMDLQVTGLEIQETVKTFSTAGKLAPIAERANGRFSSTFKMKTVLNEKMEPELSTLSGYGKLNTSQVTITQFEPLSRIGEKLKIEQFKNIAVSDVNISFSFENGRVNIQPFQVTLAGIPTTVQGSSGFDQSLDYKLGMEIPTSKIPAAATGVINQMIASANSRGANFSMSEKVKVNVGVGGTVKNPVITTDLKETGGKAVQQLKEQAKEEIDKLKKEAEEKARAEADRLKKEAEAKAKAEADRLKKQAEEKARQEKERLKNEAEKKAKDALKKIFK